MTDMPYSLSLAGGGLDQIYLNKFTPGWNLTLSIEPTYNYLERAGMASSTRNTAIQLWGNLPKGDEFENAKKLFTRENEHIGKYISGFQDASGIMMQGLTASWYNNSFMPSKVIRIQERSCLDWLQNHIQMFEVGQRKTDFDLSEFSDCNKYSAKRLAEASRLALRAIETKNIEALGKAFNETRLAYQGIFPASMPRFVKGLADKLIEVGAKGVKPNGAGGGGYFIVAIDKPINGGIPIKVR